MLKEMTREELKVKAPSVFTLEQYEKLSDKYKQYPTADVMDLLIKNDFMPVFAMQQRANTGTGKFKKHLLRFRHKTQIEGLLNKTIEEGLDIVITNSHDGTSCYNISIGIFRLICSNGLVVGNTMYNLKIRHMGTTPEQVLNFSMKLIARAPEIVNRINEFKNIQMNEKQVNSFAKEALRLRFKNEWNGDYISPRMLNSAPEPTVFRSSDLLKTWRLEDKQPTLWNVFNTLQENLIKGTKYQVHTNNGLRKIRPISNIDMNLRINQNLWKLAENYNK